jgi:hypothetical protein
MRTLKEVHEAGWKGQEAKDFLAWTNAVEKLFMEECDGLDIDSIHGDWASADMFQNGTDTHEAVEELLPSWVTPSWRQGRILDKYITRRED